MRKKAQKAQRTSTVSQAASPTLSSNSDQETKTTRRKPRSEIQKLLDDSLMYASDGKQTTKRSRKKAEAQATQPKRTLRSNSSKKGKSLPPSGHSAKVTDNKQEESQSPAKCKRRTSRTRKTASATKRARSPAQIVADSDHDSGFSLSDILPLQLESLGVPPPVFVAQMVVKQWQQMQESLRTQAGLARIFTLIDVLDKLKQGNVDLERKVALLSARLNHLQDIEQILMQSTRNTSDVKKPNVDSSDAVMGRNLSENKAKEPCFGMSGVAPGGVGGLFQSTSSDGENFPVPEEIWKKAEIFQLDELVFD